MVLIKITTYHDIFIRRHPPKMTYFHVVLRYSAFPTSTPGPILVNKILILRVCVCVFSVEFCIELASWNQIS